MLHSRMVMLPLLLAVASAAQAPSPAIPPASPGPPFTHRGGGRMFISPMGEPFRPASRDESGLADWFRMADRNHDGRLTLDEMQADADRFFALLDVNQDGEIDPDEITRYETVVAPEISSGPHFAMGGMGEPSSDGRPGRGGGGHGGYGGGHHRGGGGGNERSMFREVGSDQHQGASRFGLLDLPEPVTAADSNFNRGVSRDEFRQAAGQRFLALDLDHHGYLTLAGLQIIRPAPPPEPTRDTSPGEPPPDPNADSVPIPGNY